MITRKHVYVLAEDSRLRISLFRTLTEHGYEVRPWSCVREFLHDIKTLAPGCILLDLPSTGTDGIDLIESFDRRIEELPVVVLLNAGDNLVLAVRSMKMGASNVLELPLQETHLVAALEHVFATLEITILEANRRADAISRIGSLTEREAEVLAGLIAGRSNKIIADKLALSIRTIEMHRGRMMSRLNVDSLPAALGLAFLASAEGAVARSKWSFEFPLASASLTTTRTHFPHDHRHEVNSALTAIA